MTKPDLTMLYKLTLFQKWDLKTRTFQAILDIVEEAVCLFRT